LRAPSTSRRSLHRSQTVRNRRFYVSLSVTGVFHRHVILEIGGLAIVGRAKFAAGDLDGALALFDCALEAVEATGERWYEPELHRMRAETLLTRGEEYSSAAEDTLRAAIALAQAQEAKLWQLRAATTLAKLWHRRGRGAEAYRLLRPIYGCFSEGLNTPDLLVAKNTLLDLPVC
jgi:predicted ATPase